MKRTSRNAKPAVVSLPWLIRQIGRLRRQKKSIAFTNGCFDLLHAGHLSYLEKIKQRADVLIVGVNSDASVRELKGSGRPLVPARERARLVAALKPVDFVVLFAEKTPLRLIRSIQPDLLAKGADWKQQEIAGKAIVESAGGRVMRVPFLKGHSTTGLIQKLKVSQRRKR